jgi:hypothetical protein
MNTFRFLEILGEIDETYIIDAIKSHEHAKKVHQWKRNVVMVACFGLLIVLGFIVASTRAKEYNPDLPILAIADNYADGMGFQGYMAYEIEELVSQNPWNESLQIKTLPVYKNRATFQNGILNGASKDEKEEKLVEVAELFQIPKENLIIKESETEESALFFEYDNMRVSVGFDMMVTLSYNPIQTIPDNLNFSFYSNQEELLKVAQYLKKLYPFLFEEKDMTVNITGGDYDFQINQSFGLSFFEKKGSIEEQILDYNFRKIMFFGTENSGIWMIRFEHTDLSEKIGDYPIKSMKDAKRELSKGKYFTTVPYEMPELEYVEKVELIYKNLSDEEYLMPYYRFYIELPEEERENGMKCFGIYDVPAIESEYYTIN